MRLSIFLLYCCLFPSQLLAQFSIGGDQRVNPEDFQLSVFAQGLNYPIGMALLPDGSLLLAENKSQSFFQKNNSRLVRIVDENADGVSDSIETILDDLAVGKASDLQIADNFVVVTGQGDSILIYRLDESSGSFTLTEIGNITIQYPENWLHQHSTLAFRHAITSEDRYEIFTNFGSEFNIAPTQGTPTFDMSFGPSGSAQGDSIVRFSFEVANGEIVSASGVQDIIAIGLRNAAGMTFHPESGDLYFQDNGIDGLQNSREAHSADEINFLPLDQIGGSSIEFFGFPDNYEEYYTGVFVGGDGERPLISFQPIIDSGVEMQSEGPNDIAFAPSSFPEGLDKGLFTGFHGHFNLGGVANEENPVVFANLTDGTYFHIISNQEDGVGHIDGLAASDSSLFMADISPTGVLGEAGSNTGIIYRLKVKPSTETSSEEHPSTVRPLQISAYPNPFLSELGVSLHSESYGPVQLALFNELGQQIFVSDHWIERGDNTISLNTRDLPSARYLISVIGTDSIESLVVIKN